MQVSKINLYELIGRIKELEESQKMDFNKYRQQNIIKFKEELQRRQNKKK